MSTNVDELWTDDVDVARMTAKDFQSRDRGYRFPNSPELVGCGRALADAWDVSLSVAIDRSVRLYLASVIDGAETDYREVFDIYALLPPAGWVGVYDDWPAVAVSIPEDPPEVTASFPPTVVEVIDRLQADGHLDGEDRVEDMAEALAWVCARAD